MGRVPYREKMQVKEKILEFIEQLSEVENVKKKVMDEGSIEAAYLNSVSFIKLIVMIEEEYDIEFADEILVSGNDISLKDLCTYIENKISEVD
jgi:acyl carrier protein